MYECIFKTKLANILIQVEDKAVTKICFTKRKIKLSKHPQLINAKKQVIEYLKGNRKVFTFKLDPKGTLYQKKVWKELQKIPYGQSIYYSSIAEKIKSSPRAVGNACGVNKCLLIIPCHRVIAKKNNKKSVFSRIIDKNILLKLEV
jgi:methylated-DNA-[protein]-cysteine S-methyltransferase